MHHLPEGAGGNGMDSESYKHILESISEALITIDQDRKILVWNSAAEIMLGYKKAEVQERSLDLIIPPAYRERHREGYETFLRNIADHSTYVSKIKDYQGLRKNGEIFPIQLRHSLYKISNKEFYITATIRDITFLKRYELMRERMEHIARHDLKNKLIIIGMAAKRLTKVLDRHQVPDSSDYMKIIKSEYEDALTLLESSRELMQLESGEYPRKDVTVDLVEMVLTKQTQMQPLALSREVTITFDNRIQKQSISLNADRALLERALENLIKNAIEAENTPGEVQLILLQNEAGLAVLEIHNGGKPIPEEIQKNLFQPYVTHGKKSGSGLGLYTVKLIIEKIHRWQLDFESNSEKGTVFRIVFGPLT
ncbi:MAG: PAS domain S-box protein [Nitrospirae bacterium]|nr:PAS domain S-box protein [Nitrospirota bacterium]